MLSPNVDWRDFQLATGTPTFESSQTRRRWRHRDDKQRLKIRCQTRIEPYWNSKAASFFQRYSDETDEPQRTARTTSRRRRHFKRLYHRSDSRKRVRLFGTCWGLHGSGQTVSPQQSRLVLGNLDRRRPLPGVPAVDRPANLERVPDPNCTFFAVALGSLVQESVAEEANSADALITNSTRMLQTEKLVWFHFWWKSKMCRIPRSASRRSVVGGDTNNGSGRYLDADVRSTFGSHRLTSRKVFHLAVGQPVLALRLACFNIRLFSYFAIHCHDVWLQDKTPIFARFNRASSKGNRSSGNQTGHHARTKSRRASAKVGAQ